MAENTGTTGTAVEVDDDVEIEVIDDTPEADRGRKPLDKPVEEPTEDEIENYSDKVKARIKELTHARHDERRAKESTQREKQELERFAQQLLDENRSLKTTVNMGSQHYAETIKSAAGTELEMARRKYKEAYEAGDPDKVLEANEALTEAKMRAAAVQNYRPTALQETPIPVKQAASEPELDDKTLDWQAKNQWFGKSGFEDITSFSLGLHQQLVASGVDPRSDEYFERINARLRDKFPEVVDTSGETSRPNGSAKKPANVVAPATRSSGTRRITLTATQVALAKKYGLTPQQYAAEVIKLEKANG